LWFDFSSVFENDRYAHIIESEYIDTLSGGATNDKKVKKVITLLEKKKSELIKKLPRDSD
jgi:hypothetical protein